MDRPSTSRIDSVLFDRDYHFLSDRRAVDAVADVGWLPALSWVQREFLGRAVRHLVCEGVTQFVDVGCGIPVLGATHEVAQGADPAARVVYVDNDAVTVALAHNLVADRPRTAVLHADARDIGAVLDHPRVTDLLDLALPIGVIAVGVLHFLADTAQVMAGLASRLPPGSQLVVSHAVADGDACHPVSALTALYAATPTPLVPRTRDELTSCWPGSTSSARAWCRRTAGSLTPRTSRNRSPATASRCWLR
jgi:SAM-dependent methyltransferase